MVEVKNILKFIYGFTQFLNFMFRSKAKIKPIPIYMV